MNIDSKVQSEDPNTSEPKALEQALGSQYALQVALQTMKERCQNLQVRLANVEEENSHLRSKKGSPTSVTVPSEMKSEVEQLQEQVSLLTRQKSQLTHHICMVATENQQLWNRLSRVTQANQSLGSHLSKISDTLSKHDSSVPAGSKSTTKELETKGLNPSTTANGGDQSLDEISLKLINSLIQEKAELEDQYSQMVDIQSNDTFPIQNLGFAFMDQEEDFTVKEVTEHCSQLKDMKKTLADQHKILKSAIKKVEKSKKGQDVLCHQCRDKAKRQSVAESQIDDKAYMETLRQWGATQVTDDHRKVGVKATPEKTSLTDENTDANPDHNATPANVLDGVRNEDRLCPMCGQFYPRQLPYEDFQAHVMTHFNDEFDPALENFEVVM